MLGIYLPSPPVQWSWTTLSGPDAQDFLHRVTTVHVKALQPGQGARGCLLTAQGRIRSFFHLWHLNAQEFALEYDAGPDGAWKRELVAAIDQLTFAEKMTLQDHPEIASRWLFFKQGGPLCADFEGIAPGETRELAGGIRVSHEGALDYGREWITLLGSADALGAFARSHFPSARQLEFAELEAWRIESVSPRVSREITQASIPLEVGLRSAIAENKGCYPGQEVIEKIIALGSPPRRLVRLDGQGQAPEPGQKILNAAEPPAELGEVTSVAPSEGGKFIALGIIKKIHAKEGLPVRLSGGAEASIARVAPYEA